MFRRVSRCVRGSGLGWRVYPPRGYSAGAEGLTPNSFSHRIRKSVDALRRNGITVSFRKSNGDRLICLKRVDGVDDPATENIVTIDPDNPPCFGV